MGLKKENLDRAFAFPEENFSFDSLPITDVCDFPEEHTRFCVATGNPALGFLFDSGHENVPGPVGLNRDVRTRAELILSGLCHLPTVIAFPGTSLSIDSLKCIHDKMTEVSRNNQLPLGRDVYLRTRSTNTRSHKFSSRGLLVKDIQSESIVIQHVGGKYHGREVTRLENWVRELPADTSFMIHLENDSIQRQHSLHLQIRSDNNQSELVVGHLVPHARLLMREGRFLHISNGGSLDSLERILEDIAEGRDEEFYEVPIMSQEYTGMLLREIEWLTSAYTESEAVERIAVLLSNHRDVLLGNDGAYKRGRKPHPSSSAGDAQRLAQWLLPFMAQVCDGHTAVTKRWGMEAVSEMRIYFGFTDSRPGDARQLLYTLPDSGPEVMDVDWGF